MAAQQLSTSRKQEAASPIHRAMALHRQGRLAEAEQIYASVLEIKPDQFDALHLLGLLRHQQGRRAEALRLVTAALQINPVAVDALSNHGIILASLNLHLEAVASFRRALAVKPDHIDALHHLGNALGSLHRWDEALQSLDRALAGRPDDIGILNDRGGVLSALDRHGEALECYDRALASDEGRFEVHINRATASAALNRYDEALASLTRATAIEPGSAEANWNASLIRLRLGNFDEGWKGYEWRWKKRDWADQVRNFRQRLWLGEEPLAGRTILLHAEQGLGDTIQFVRYAPLIAARGAKVVLEVQPPLKALMANMPGVAATVARGEPLPTFDQHCPLMSLPLAFRTRLDTIPAQMPYIHAPAERVAVWKARVSATIAPRVGLVWAGGTAHRNDHNRSIPLERMASLFEAKASFVCLQRELSRERMDFLRKYPHVISLGEELNDFGDTAAVISLLDLVISVDTSVAHLAGAMGRPVWILVPFAPDFRWMLDRDDSPWYPAARLFRQTRIGDWEGVLARVRGELESFEKAES